MGRSFIHFVTNHMFDRQTNRFIVTRPPCIHCSVIISGNNGYVVGASIVYSWETFDIWHWWCEICDNLLAIICWLVFHRLNSECATHDVHICSCQPMKVPLPSDNVVVRECRCGSDGSALITDVASVLACGNNEHNKLGLNQRQGFLMAMKNMFNKVQCDKCHRSR